MGRQTEIEWCDATWNPWYGCRKISPGCKLCYAEREMTRYGKPFGEVVRAKTTFRDPLKWKDPKRIFTCSWSDWFIKEADEWRAEAWEIIRQTPQHTYLILTKRIDRVGARHGVPLPWGDGQPWPNVWLGTSAENQEQADKRIPILLQIPAAVHWVSNEPALTPVDFSLWLRKCVREWVGDKFIHTDGLNWLVVGGESARLKATARPFEVGIAFDTIDQCRAAGVPCFVKQLGSNVRVSMDTYNRRGGRGMFFHPYDRRAEEFIIKLDDWKGGDMAEWPEGLRVREWPRTIMNSEL
jgi:protein gp37